MTLRNRSFKKKCIKWNIIALHNNLMLVPSTKGVSKKGSKACKCMHYVESKKKNELLVFRIGQARLYLMLWVGGVHDTAQLLACVNHNPHNCAWGGERQGGVPQVHISHSELLSWHKQTLKCLLERQMTGQITWTCQGCTLWKSLQIAALEKNMCLPMCLDRQVDRSQTMREEQKFPIYQRQQRCWPTKCSQCWGFHWQEGPHLPGMSDTTNIQTDVLRR